MDEDAPLTVICFACQRPVQQFVAKRHRGEWFHPQHVPQAA